MARKTLTREELLKAWAEMEKKERLSKGEVIVPAENAPVMGTLLRKELCKYCANSFYRNFDATENFPTPAEYCGCRVKQSLVDPNGRCECFA